MNKEALKILENNSNKDKSNYNYFIPFILSNLAGSLTIQKKFEV